MGKLIDVQLQKGARILAVSFSNPIEVDLVVVFLRWLLQDPIGIRDRMDLIDRPVTPVLVGGNGHPNWAKEKIVSGG